MVSRNQRKTRQAIKPDETEELELETETEELETGAETGDETDQTGGEENPEEEEYREEESDTIKVRSKPTRKKPKREHWRTRKKREEAAQEASTVLLTIFDGLVSMSLGDDCRMNRVERELISEPLERIIARSGFGTSDLLQKYSDPILLVMGLVAWGSRVARIKSLERKKAIQESTDQEPDQDPDQEEETPLFSHLGDDIDLGELTAVPVTIQSSIGELDNGY